MRMTWQAGPWVEASEYCRRLRLLFFTWPRGSSFMTEYEMPDGSVHVAESAWLSTAGADTANWPIVQSQELSA